MSTLEEEIVRPLKEQLSLRPSNLSTPPVKHPALFRWWHHAFIGLLIFALSIGVCGVFKLKTSWGDTWRGALRDFKWLVFVKGDPLAVDEVGRFLKQLDGTREVIYQSPEDALVRFRGEKLAAPIDLLDTNPFPPSWAVTWKESYIGSTRMQEAFQDTSALPGVADVAYDSTLIDRLHIYRAHWMQAKWILGVLIVMGLLIGVALGGFLIARMPFAVERRKTIIGAMASDFLFWSAGFALVFWALGPLPWVLLAGGVIAAALRWMMLTALRLS